jgi:ribokinase
MSVPFILDPAPAQALSTELLRNITWLTPNESEMRSILANLEYSTITLDGHDAIVSASEHLLATGVRNVILKLGERGVFLSGKDVPPTYIAPYNVKAVDTTAAGDAFNGGFAFGLTNGMTPVDAARFACGVAAVSVTRTGAQTSMPTLEEVNALTNSGVEIPRQYIAK